MFRTYTGGRTRAAGEQQRISRGMERRGVQKNLGSSMNLTLGEKGQEKFVIHGKREQIKGQRRAG